MPRAAVTEMFPGVEHRRHNGLSNRTENVQQPMSEREGRMRRFTIPRHARRFLAAYGPIASCFLPRCHRLTTRAYRDTSDERFATWRVVTSTPDLA